MLSVAQKILMQDTGNKGEGERSVFTYTTDSETRSFRSIAQKIQARSGGTKYPREVRELGVINKSTPSSDGALKLRLFNPRDKGFRKGVWGITLYQRVSPES